MILLSPDSFIKYSKSNNMVYRIYADALDNSPFRDYILNKAAPIWNPRYKFNK